MLRATKKNKYSNSRVVWKKIPERNKKHTPLPCKLNGRSLTKTIIINIKILTLSYFFQGTESISDYAISFHYVPPQKMYALEFYIYHLRPYGIESGHQHLNVHDRHWIQNGTRTYGIESGHHHLNISMTVMIRNRIRTVPSQYSWQPLNKEWNPNITINLFYRVIGPN